MYMRNILMTKISLSIGDEGHLALFLCAAPAGSYLATTCLLLLGASKQETVGFHEKLAHLAASMASDTTLSK